MATEDEEFEFRLRMEQEAAAEAQNAPSGPRSTTAAGVGSEIGKGAVRGVVGAGDTGAMASRFFPPTALAGLAAEQLAPDITRRAGETIKAFRERLLAQNKADPNASRVEQMLGTGTELATQGLLTGGAGGTVRQAAVNTLAPAVGGAVGEQVGGETGKLIGAVTGPLATSRIGAALKPEISPGLKRLVEAGALPTVGQTMGGGLKKLETFPILSNIAEGAVDTSTKSFALAANNIALEPLRMGKQPLGKIDLSKVSGNDLYAKADDIAQAEYDKLLPKLSMKIDPQLPQELAAIKAAHPEVADKLDAVQKTIFKIMSKKGTTNITGEDMKLVESKLGKLARRANANNSDIMADELADGISEFQGALRDMVARQNPAEAAQLTRINEAWSNLVRVRKATIGATASNDGFFTPQQFAAAVARVNASRTGQAVARGEAGMQDVSTAGLENMAVRPGRSVPYSALARGATGLAATMGPGAAAGAAAGLGATGAGLGALAGLGAYGAAYTPTAQGVLRSFLTGDRGRLTGTLGEILRDTRTNPAFVTGFPQLQNLQSEE